MAIDWSDAEPDFTRGRVVELRTMADAMRLLDEWQQAYDEAATAWARLHSDYIDMKARAEYAESLALTLNHIYKVMAEPANADAFDRFVTALRLA